MQYPNLCFVYLPVNYPEIVHCTALHIPSLCIYLPVSVSLRLHLPAPIPVAHLAALWRCDAITSLTPTEQTSDFRRERDARKGAEGDEESIEADIISSSRYTRPRHKTHYCMTFLAKPFMWVVSE